MPYNRTLNFRCVIFLTAIPLAEMCIIGGWGFEGVKNKILSRDKTDSLAFSIAVLL